VRLGQLPSPVRLQVDRKGNLLALDGKSHRIVRVDASGGFGIPGGEGAAGRPVVAAFKLDADDNLYLLDIGSGKVLVADPAGIVMRQLDLPKGALVTDIAVDGGGSIYAVDGVGATVWSAARDATAFAQLGRSLKDRMSFPAYAVAHQGKLILVDQYGMGLVVIGLDGSYLGGSSPSAGATATSTTRRSSASARRGRSSWRIGATTGCSCSRPRGEAFRFLMR
jgi:hypothetical protein